MVSTIFHHYPHILSFNKYIPLIPLSLEFCFLYISWINSFFYSVHFSLFLPPLYKSILSSCLSLMTATTSLQVSGSSGFSLNSILYTAANVIFFKCKYDCTNLGSSLKPFHSSLFLSKKNPKVPKSINMISKALHYLVSAYFRKFIFCKRTRCSDVPPRFPLKSEALISPATEMWPTDSSQLKSFSRNCFQPKEVTSPKVTP